MSNRPSINVQRRRKGSPPSGQAQAPGRPGSSGGTGGGGTSGGGFRPSGGLPIPSGGKLGGCGGAVVVIIIIAYVLLSGGLSGGGEGVEVDSFPSAPEESGGFGEETLPTNTPRPTRAASSGTTGQKWLVMLYQDADDQILEQDIYVDLNEAERVGSTDRVTIVAQIDRYQGAFADDGNWTGTRRFLVSRDDDLTSVSSELVSEIGEANMADGSTLVDFAEWAIETYPADRYVLILSDHGMGWPGGWTDPSPASRDGGRAPLISALKGDGMYLNEIDAALEEIRSRTGLDKFDVIGMDACLMSQMEVYAALEPHALYAVASEEVEPALGWAYTSFLDALASNPDISSETLVTEVVNSYIVEDQRIVDAEARMDFLRQGNPMGGFFGVQDVGASRLANQMGLNSTLTAVDLQNLPALMDALNNFAYALQDTDQAAVARARSHSQGYTNVFGQNAPPAYIDLGHFASLAARETGSGTVSQAANALLDVLQNDVVVAEKHGGGKPGSTGISIYFPNSTMYRSPYTGPQSYNLIADRWVQVSLWDDFMAYHYNDRSFDRDDAESVAPSQGAASRAPGAGQILVSNVTASSSSLEPGETTQISAQIDGTNIGYLYLFIGLYDPDSNSIFVADTDFLESPDTQELSGIYYPVWPEGGSFDINFEWDASVFSISDGTNTVMALFNPTTYGATAETAVYSVNGTYTFADTGEQRYAQLLFMDGKLFQILGYNSQDPANPGEVTGSPWEITPSAGDSFTLLQKWMDLDSSGNVTQIVNLPADTLFFSGENFTWAVEYAPARDYLIGFIATDLDGNMSQGFTMVTVR